MTSQPLHLSAERLLALAQGAAPRAEDDAHLERCGACATVLDTFRLAVLPGTPAAEARLQRALREELEPRTAPRERRNWVRPLAMAGAFGLAVAGISLFAPPLAVERGAEMLAPIWADGRPSDARPELALPWSSLRLARGEANGRVAVPLGALLSAWEADPTRYTSGLVAAFLARGEPGDLARAEEVLAGRPVDAAAENDRGVVAHAAGRPAVALGHFERSLGLRPAAPHVAFNKAVALEALGRRPEARAAWEAYLALAAGEQAGWREEATRRLAALRAD